MHYLIFSAEFIAFAMFGWAMKSWFVKNAPPARWEPFFIRIAAYVFASAQLAVALFYPFPNGISYYTGLMLIITGGSLFIWAVKTFNAQKPAFAFSDTQTAGLVTNGPHRIIRHPFYAAYSLVWLGGTIGTQCWWLLISFVTMFYMYLRAARLEESQWLSGGHQSMYQSYIQSTGMFLPKLFL